MTDRSRTPHATHDLFLVAAHAAGDTLGTDTERAAALVATCPDCGALAADLVAIAAATHDLPAAARPRDFTLRPEDAARLRPMGWRRLAAAFGASRLELVRPLAAGLTTLGLAGILLAGLPAVQGQAGGAVLSKVGAAIRSDSGAAAASSSASVAAAPAASAAASGAYPDGGALTPVVPSSGGGEAASPAAGGSLYGTAASPAASGDESIRSAVGQPTASSPPQLAPAVQDSGSATSGVNVPLLSVSIVLLVVGLGLLLLRRATKNAGGA
ncbi:MAG: hypothetical protein ACJ77B_11605 [Chloroflexota bacterium]